MAPDSLVAPVPPDTEVLDHVSALLQARYGAADAPAAARSTAVLETLLAHRSVRSFLTTPLPDETLGLLVAAAQSAATWSNLQAWSVVAIRDPARKARLAALANHQKHIVQAPLFLVWLADLDRLAAVATAEGSPAEGLDYLDLLVVAITDATLAAQNAVAAAESLGLGTVYIGSIRNHIEAVAAELGLPPRVLPVTGLSIGYPDPSVATDIKPRLAPSVVLHEETYRRDGHEAAVARYNAELGAFQRAQGLPVENWSSKVAERVASPEVLGGRQHLREVLGRLGFPLR